MHRLKTKIAWRLWKASCGRALKQYEAALKDPARQQERYLKSILRDAEGSQWALEHGVDAATNMDRFREGVPIMDASDLEVWTDQIRKGHQRVLNNHPVERLIPTSGSTGPRKLIPMNAYSRREFTDAISVWVGSLLNTRPGIMNGRCYIATSPAESYDSADSVVPISFAQDADYLNPIAQRILKHILAVPPEVAYLRDDAWTTSTREHLLKAEDLSFISLWHPSYLTALFNSEELQTASSKWSQLKVISSWSEGSCQSAAGHLMSHFPKVELQTKGLWLTEGVISNTWKNHRPLALTSAFLEFENIKGEVKLGHELNEGECYRPILTNHAGLYRYRLGDLVRVKGFIGETPNIEWAGRSDYVSDLCGEKLNDAQVGQALDSIGWNDFALLVPDTESTPQGYICYLLHGRSAEFPVDHFEKRLRQNPHYEWARKIGQLGPVSLQEISHSQHQLLEQAGYTQTRSKHIKARHLVQASSSQDFQSYLKTK